MPAAARVLLGRLASGDERDAPQITTAEEWQVAGLARTTTATRLPGGRPTTASTWALRGPGWSRWKSRIASPAFHTAPLMPSSRVRRNGRRPSATEARAARRHGSVDWHGQGPCDGHPLRLDPGSHGDLQHRADRPVCRGQAYELLVQIDGMAMTEIRDGKPVPVSQGAFWYTDGLTATPSIRGGPERALIDPQPPCEPWLFGCWTSPRTISCRTHPTSGETEASVCSR